MLFFVPKNKRWKELTVSQRVGIIVMGSVQITLLALALVDIRRRPTQQINGSKRLWSAFAFVNFIGPIAYFAFGRKR